MTPTTTDRIVRRRFAFAVPYGGATADPIPLLMTEPAASCGVVRPLWVFPDSDEYLLYHTDDDAFEQMAQFVSAETRIDEYARKLAPFYDSIQHFLRDASLRLHRAAIIDEITKYPELIPAIASIFAAHEGLQRRRGLTSPASTS